MPPKDLTIQNIIAPTEAIREESPLIAAKKLIAKSKRNRDEMASMTGQIEMELVKYDGQNIPIDLNFDWSHETVWATRQQIALLFDRDTATISDHIDKIYESAELERDSTTGFFPVTRREGDKQVARELEHYNLDVILSVGYRVSSAKATEFRKWATQTLRKYIMDGFALNESRLRSDPNALRELAARVRTLRADEKNIYQGVREVFAFGSADYDKDSQIVRSFYAKVQDKFFHAVTGKTASELKLHRADHTKPSMGLITMNGDLPDRASVDVAKNYLFEQELYSLHILCEQFLLFVESKAVRGQKLTMAELSAKFDDLLRFQGHTVFAGYQQYLTQKAKSHAQRELDLWRERVQEIPRDQKRLA